MKASFCLALNCVRLSSNCVREACDLVISIELLGPLQLVSSEAWYDGLGARNVSWMFAMRRILASCKTRWLHNARAEHSKCNIYTRITPIGRKMRVFLHFLAHCLLAWLLVACLLGHESQVGSSTLEQMRWLGGHVQWQPACFDWLWRGSNWLNGSCWIEVV